MRDRVLATLALAALIFLTAAFVGVWLAVVWIVFRALAL